MSSESATKGYTHGKKRTNLSLDKELVRWARKYFKKTGYGSMSNALEAHLRDRKLRAERKAAKKPAKSQP